MLLEPWKFNSYVPRLISKAQGMPVWAWSLNFKDLRVPQSLFPDACFSLPLLFFTLKITQEGYSNKHWRQFWYFWQEANNSNTVLLKFPCYLTVLKTCQNYMRRFPGQIYAKYYSCLHGLLQQQHRNTATEISLGTDINFYLAPGQQSKKIKPWPPYK